MSNELAFDTLELWKIDEERIRLAALTICGKARDLEDARYLLTAAGILPEPDAKPLHHLVRAGFVPGSRSTKGKKSD